MSRPETAMPSPHTAQRSGPPDRVIVLSDLHMGAGTWPGEGIDPLEHFFHDEELSALIERLAARGARQRRRYLLVLNGDVFDFVRTVRLPASAREVAAWRVLLAGARVRAPARVLADAAAGRFTLRERRYGPDAGEHESIWKLWVMAQGHPRVFEALAAWCRAGHELVLVRGNHDLEWAWPGVRRAMRLLLRSFGSGPIRPRQVRFRMHGYRCRNLHVEHGHVLRWTTHTEGRFTRGARRRLKQPFGSFINRYILNPVERLALRAPGVPASLHLKQQLRHEPLLLWRGLLGHALRAIPTLGPATWTIWHRRAHRWWPTRVGIGLGAGVLMLPLLGQDLLALLHLESAQRRTGAALLALATPHLGLALLETMAIVRDNTARRARVHARNVAAARSGADPGGERIVVLGHTHYPELLEWTDGHGRAVYANPGCWMDEEGAGEARPRFVWTAWNGQAYGRTCIMEVEGSTGRCRTHSRS